MVTGMGKTDFIIIKGKPAIGSIFSVSCLLSILYDITRPNSLYWMDGQVSRL